MRYPVALLLVFAHLTACAYPIRCDEPVAFDGLVLHTDTSGASVTVDVLACSVPVTLTVDVYDNQGTVCVEPPFGAPVCAQTP